MRLPWGKFILITFYAPIVTIGEWLGAWSHLYGTSQDGDVRVNILAWIALLAGPIFGAVVLYRDVAKERNVYWGLLANHYGIVAVLHRLRELRREGARVRSTQPANDPFSAPNTKAAVASWRALYEEWKGKTCDTIRELCPQNLKRFEAIDVSIMAGPQVHNLYEVRQILGAFDQHLRHLDWIINELSVFKS
ncbi:MAG: hypothetical protein SGJ20_02295 [Planctomycetota bacterium]|nr:hypothetical protein [Planctomycetota bacterium]